MNLAIARAFRGLSGIASIASAPMLIDAVYRHKVQEPRRLGKFASKLIGQNLSGTTPITDSSHRVLEHIYKRYNFIAPDFNSPEFNALPTPSLSKALVSKAASFLPSVAVCNAMEDKGQVRKKTYVGGGLMPCGCRHGTGVEGKYCEGELFAIYSNLLKWTSHNTYTFP